MSDTTEVAEPIATENRPAQPQFYQTPEPLNASRHGKLGLNRRWISTLHDMQRR